jgi:hypothetical protein
MQSLKPPKFTDLSLLEKIINQNISHILLNLALYLSLVLPLAKQIELPPINSPWQNVSNEVSLIVLISGFGFVCWISGEYIGPFLRSVRTILEFFFIKILERMDINLEKKDSPMSIYFKSKSFLSKSDILSYLSSNENKFLERLYIERLEMDAKYYLRKDNTIATLTLFLLHYSFRYQISSFTLYIPKSLVLLILFLLILSSSEYLPEDHNYFYVPGNPIRNTKYGNSD